MGSRYIASDCAPSLHAIGLAPCELWARLSAYVTCAYRHIEPEIERYFCCREIDVDVLLIIGQLPGLLPLLMRLVRLPCDSSRFYIFFHLLFRVEFVFALYSGGYFRKQ